MSLKNVYTLQPAGEVAKFPLFISTAGGTFYAQWRGTGSITFSGASFVMTGMNSATLTVAPGVQVIMRVLVSVESDPISDVTIWQWDSPATPVEMANIGGDSFTLVKNWDFGTSGNIGSYAALDAEFYYHDQFNQISNGSGQYGTVTAATGSDTAISVSESYWTGQQPIDPGNKYREFTDTTMLARIQRISGTGTVGPYSAYNGACGTLRSKFWLPSGGADLGKDIVWETRIRFKPKSPGVFPGGYWFALWTIGDIWDAGPEMDVVEAWYDPSGDLENGDAWHSNSVGGEDEQFANGDSWWTGLEASGMPGVAVGGPQSLVNWHTFTWVYKADNTYEVWCDGYRFQKGVLPWRVPSSNAPTSMWFIWDMAALHSDIPPMNTYVIPEADLPLEYELDYSRVWLRGQSAVTIP